MMRPASRFGASLCPSDGAAGGGCPRPHCRYRYRRRHRHRHEASPPSAAPWPAAWRSQGLSLPSVTNENENAKQQCKPIEVFPCENQDGNSKLSPFRSRHVFTKRSRYSSLVKLEIKLQESDDECDLVIDVPPQVVTKKPRISRKCPNGKRDEELASLRYAEELRNSAIADVPESAEEESERMMILRKNDKGLSKHEKLGNVSPKANKICLPDVNSDILKVLEERDALAYAKNKCVSSAPFFEAGIQKGILKQGNTDTNISILTKAFVQEHTNEDSVSSGRVTQSVLCTGQSSKDETTIERLCKKIVNTEESQSIEENEANDSPEDTYLCPTTSSYEKGSEKTLLSSSVEEVEPSEEDTELSESDDPLDECRRIFDEFEREVQKKNNDKQGHDAGIQQSMQFGAAVKRGQDFTATTSEQKKTMSELPATQFQSIGPMASLNLVQIHPVKISSGQLHTLLQENVATAMPCGPSVSSFKRTGLVPCKISTQQRPSVPELGSKVPFETRQRYVGLFFAECFRIYNTVNEAVDKALIEEQSVYDRCGSKKMYLNFAVKTLKKLRDHGQLSNCRSSSGAGSIKSEEEEEFSGSALYELLKDYLLTEDQLNENNFPRPNPEKNGIAIFTGVVKNAGYDAFKRICCRCGEVYAITSSGEQRRKEECNYHSGRVLKQKVPGGMEKRYSCCDRIVGSAGCQNAKLHVHDGRRAKLEGFMKTLIKSPPFDGNYGVYALDCEKCYTTHGLELTRVTVVDAKLQVIYDTFVKPDGKVVDYDIRLSGATEDDLKNTTTSLRDVQAILLNLFSADTVLIGHELENDLFVLKLIHSTVVDTSIVFPHRLGFPHKRGLRSLMADYLRRIRQDDVNGHNSREDAIACMELILWKIKEDNKRRK